MNSKASFELAMKFGAHIPIKWRTKQRQESNSWKSEPFLLNPWGFKKSQTANLELAIFISRMGIARCIKSWPYLHDHGLDYWPKRPHKWIRIWIMSIRIPNSYSLHFSSIFCSFEMNRIKSSLISTVSPLEKSVGLRLVHELRQLPHLEHRRDWWRSGRRPTLQSFGDSSLFVVFCRFRVASLEFPPCVGKFHAWKPAIWSKANSGSSRRSWWHKPI